MDKTDPVCGMQGHINAHGHYFCSEACIRKYEKQNRLAPYCPSCDAKPQKWYKEKLYVVGIATIIIFAASYIFSPLNPLFDSLVNYVKVIWWAVLLGLLLGGMIDYFVPREYIENYLGKHNKSTIFLAVVLGFLMSACSHGILAIAIELYKKGANTSSVIAFLLASPWANLPITILFFSFFGLNALFIIFSAILIAITTGLIYQVLEKRKMVECNKCGHASRENFSVWSDVKKRWKSSKFGFKDAVNGVLSGSFSLAKMVLWWILIGMLLASIANAFVPSHIFQQYLGPTLSGLLITLVLATIIEVCSEGSAPLAFEIFKQTGAFGNSFVFLMAGVATDYTEIGLIWSNIGKKAALWLPVITVPQILILGYLFNLLL